MASETEEGQKQEADGGKEPIPIMSPTTESASSQETTQQRGLIGRLKAFLSIGPQKQSISGLPQPDKTSDAQIIANINAAYISRTNIPDDKRAEKAVLERRVASGQATEEERKRLVHIEAYDEVFKRTGRTPTEKEIKKSAEINDSTNQTQPPTRGQKAA